MDKLLDMWDWFNDKESAHGRAWRTFYQTFIALFMLSLISFIDGFADWAGGADFPDFTILVSGIASAATGAVAATVSYLQNKVERK